MTAAGDVPVRDAATVVLLRDGAEGVEAWLLTRVTGMEFAAGMTVFPGGRVDDRDVDLPITGADTAALAARFGCSEPVARGLLGAAVRETFEETGVLLTVPPKHLPEHVADVESGQVDFGDLLREHGLSVDGAALRPWSRWVTPKGEVRRYDTRFFVGRLPEGAVAADVTTESSSADWVPVGEAIEQAQRGERRLLPPTLLTLASLADCADVDAVLARSEGADLSPVRPTMHVADDGAVTVELPGGRLMQIRGPRA
ncbi:NUDIX hydrolase [Jatrophihabitans fulvus]